jgi:hypothetical protein
MQVSAGMTQGIQCKTSFINQFLKGLYTPKYPVYEEIIKMFYIDLIN